MERWREEENGGNGSVQRQKEMKEERSTGREKERNNRGKEKELNKGGRGRGGRWSKEGVE